MNLKTFNKGDIIFKQGDFAHGMYDIISGSVGIYVGFGTEHEVELTVLKAGDYLGEMGMIEIYPRSATAVALEDGTELREIGEAEFSDYFKAQPERLLAIMRQLSQRLRDRTADYEAACKVLDDLKDTHEDPGKRSPSLVEKVKKLLAFYDNVMNACGDAAYMSYFPNDRYFY